MKGKKKKGYIPIYKIIVLGPKFAGKTQIIYRYINNTFDPIYKETLEVKSFRKNIDINENTPVEADHCIVELVDLFPLNHEYLRNPSKPLLPNESNLRDYMEIQMKSIVSNNSQTKRAYAYVFVFDLTEPDSINKAREIADIIHKAEEANKQKSQASKFVTKKMFLGNKKDRTGVTSVIDKSQGPSLCTNYGATYFEVSALTNENITKAFTDLAKNIHKDVYVKKEIQKDRIEIVDVEDEENKEETSVFHYQFYFFKDDESRWRSCCFGLCGSNKNEDHEIYQDSDSEEEDEETRDENKPTKGKPTKQAGGCIIF